MWDRPFISPLPATERPNVDMDEIRLRVRADATCPQGQGCLGQMSDADAGNADVDCLARHMQAMGGHAIGAGGQHGVGLGRAIARDDLKRLPRAQAGLQGMEQIENGGIDDMGLVSAVIAHQMVNLA